MTTISLTREAYNRLLSMASPGEKIPDTMNRIVGLPPRNVQRGRRKGTKRATT
jgi:predicted CopG family antitoxin